jgi:Protein of unknown function (DUF3352)
MERRSISKVLLALLVIPVILVLAGVAWFMTYDPFQAMMSRNSEPTTTIFVSQNAPLSLSLTVNPDQLLSVSPYPLGGSKAQPELENFRDSLLGVADYKTSIQPWLGDEMTVAVTSRDVDRTLQDGRQPGYLLVLKTQDTEASRSFLRSFWRQRAALLTNNETYKGSEITYGEVKNSIPQFSDVPFTLASAIVGNQYVLFANSPKVLKDAINNVQASELNLRGNAQYQKALGSIDPKRLGMLYVNLPEFTALTGNDAIVRSLAQLPDQSPVTYSTIAMALKGSKTGLILDTVLVPEIGLSSSEIPVVVPQSIASSSEPIKLLGVMNLLPADSMTIAVGEDLNKVWSAIGNTVKGYPALEQLQQNSLKALESQSQLNLIKDIFQWVNGEYGLAIAAPKGKQASEWVFAVKREGSKIQQGLDQLDKIARDRGLNIGPVKIGDQIVQAWTQLNSTSNSEVLNAKTIAAHSTISDYEVFSTSIETLGKLANQSEKTLNNNSIWNQSIHNIATPNQGYFYADWNAVKPIVETQVPGLKFLEILAQPLVSHLQSFTLSAQPGSSEVTKSTIVISLK